MALLRQELDPGEAAAIALAVEFRAELLLIDERAGRLAAQRLGLECGGSIRVILEAKRRGFVPSVADALARMQAGGMWIDAELVRSVLEFAGETGEDD